MWFKKYRLEAPFKEANVNCENLDLYFSKNSQQITAFVVFFSATFVVFFRGSLTKQSLEDGFGFPQ